MTQNICECHCGTRIDLDEQLLQQREMWRQKYLCLQKQLKIDIQTLKNNIYAQCAGIMQQQFTQKQLQHNKIINQKNIQIKDLIARIINLQTQIKILTKEKQILEQQKIEFNGIINEKDQIINNLKNKSDKSQRNWEIKHQQQLVNVKQKLGGQAKESIDKLEAERDILKQKLKQFETKYQKLIPQIQKMKNLLTQKCCQNQQLLNTLQKIKKKQDDDIYYEKNKYDDLNKIHTTCQKQIKNLNDKNQQLLKQIQKSKKISRDIRVEPVYIERPVEVEKIVEKIIEVQKIVNKYIQHPNNDKKIKLIQDDNVRLKDQLNNVLKQIKEIQEHFHHQNSYLQQSIKQHQKNAQLYKKQRETLAHRIGEQNKQIQLLQNFIEKIGAEKINRPQQSDNEKIVVHVKPDGTYQKTVERFSSVPVNNKKKK